MDIYHSVRTQNGLQDFQQMVFAHTYTEVSREVCIFVMLFKILWDRRYHRRNTGTNMLLSGFLSFPLFILPFPIPLFSLFLKVTFSHSCSLHFCKAREDRLQNILVSRAINYFLIVLKEYLRIQGQCIFCMGSENSLSFLIRQSE